MSYNIVIVDDDDNFIDTLKDSVKEKVKDVDIVVFSNVKEALGYISSKLPDMLILDVNLKEMNGIEFLKMIKSFDKLKDMVIIMVSAKYIEPLDRSNALKLGAVAYYIKPFDIDKLCNEIRYYINKKLRR